MSAVIFATVFMIMPMSMRVSGTRCIIISTALWIEACLYISHVGAKLLKHFSDDRIFTNAYMVAVYFRCQVSITHMPRQHK